jgi:hypothetical protein
VEGYIAGIYLVGGRGQFEMWFLVYDVVEVEDVTARLLGVASDDGQSTVTPNAASLDVP